MEYPSIIIGENGVGKTTYLKNQFNEIDCEDKEKIFVSTEDYSYINNLFKPENSKGKDNGNDVNTFEKNSDQNMRKYQLKEHKLIKNSNTLVFILRDVEEYLFKNFRIHCFFNISSPNNNQTFITVQVKNNKKDQEVTSPTIGLYNIIIPFLELFLYDFKYFYLDEPFYGIHPVLKEKVVNCFIKECKDRNCNLVISSHHPSVITYETIEYLRFYNKDKLEKIRFDKLNNEIEKNICKNTLLNNKLALFSQKILIVEGITDKIFFGILFKDNREVGIIECGGGGHIPKLINIMPVNTYGIVDNDNKHKNIGEKYKKSGLDEDILERIVLLPKEYHVLEEFFSYYDSNEKMDEIIDKKLKNSSAFSILCQKYKIFDPFKIKKYIDENNFNEITNQIKKEHKRVKLSKCKKVIKNYLLKYPEGEIKEIINHNFKEEKDFEGLKELKNDLKERMNVLNKIKERIEKL